ncbi:MAG: DNA repair protein RecO [Anaerolineales bacterium]|nr:DNA repair protein RecO [Anaerolineales bacterium]MCX7608182.1 DNA repair protein RecO [Anaerolineales bacterium]MDW8226351.1 DNA repair protein RecO [Anaerolineales bacterium]
MGEPRSFRVEAIVLRHSDWGEADRLLVLYARERGKLRALAKGARRIKSRKAGHLEPFTRVTLQLARGRDLPIVTQAETLDPYFPLREDLIRMAHAAWAVELLDRFTYEDAAENLAVFSLLAETLKRLAVEADPWLALRYYEVRLLDLLGFRPRLFECVECRKAIEPVNQYFSPTLGGVLCPSCGEGRKDLWAISVDALRYWRHFQRSEYTEARRAAPSSATRNELEHLLQGYETYLLERSLHAPSFLRQLKQR